MVEKYGDYIEKISKETGFIQSTLEKVERLIRVLEWLNSDIQLNKLLALKGGTAINTAIFNFPRLSVDIDLDLTENLKKEEMIKERENIEKIKKQDIKTKLLPTLKDRNPRNNDVNEMKQAVKKYLKDILVVDDNIKEFYVKFQKGIYEPELIFADKELIERIKDHPMIMWKLNNNKMN